MSDTSKEVADIVRRCEEWVAGMQKRSVASACIHRHMLAMLGELRERECSIEDVQVCLEFAVRPILEAKLAAPSSETQPPNRIKMPKPPEGFDMKAVLTGMYMDAAGPRDWREGDE